MQCLALLLLSTVAAELCAELRFWGPAARSGILQCFSSRQELQNGMQAVSAQGLLWTYSRQDHPSPSPWMPGPGNKPSPKQLMHGRI